MERVIERCCGLDSTRRPWRDWLEAYGVTHVAMESTGVYWKPIFYVLEDAFTCVLANAAQIAQVPGRKTDVRDCVWIAPCRARTGRATFLAGTWPRSSTVKTPSNNTGVSEGALRGPPCGQSNISTVRATSPAFIARNASFTSSSRPRRVIISSRRSRPRW